MLIVEPRRSDPKTDGQRASVQAPVPDRDHEIGVPDRQGTGKVNGISASERMATGEFAGPTLDGQWFAVAGGLFACSLLLRSLDEPVCGSFGAGTHFLWHLLNALVLYLLGRALVLRWRVLPTQA